MAPKDSRRTWVSPSVGMAEGRPPKDSMNTPIPEYIDREAWIGFVEMREKSKRPLTSRAKSRLLHRLDELHRKGHDVNACLDQSTFRNWQDVYPLKDEVIPDLTPKQTVLERREYQPMTPEQKALLERTRSVLKRVA